MTENPTGKLSKIYPKADLLKSFIFGMLYQKSNQVPLFSTVISLVETTTRLNLNSFNSVLAGLLFLSQSPI